MCFELGERLAGHLGLGCQLWLARDLMCYCKPLTAQVQ